METLASSEKGRRPMPCSAKLRVSQAAKQGPLPREQGSDHKRSLRVFEDKLVGRKSFIPVSPALEEAPYGHLAYSPLLEQITGFFELSNGSWQLGRWVALRSTHPTGCRLFRPLSAASILSAKSAVSFVFSLFEASAAICVICGLLEKITQGYFAGALSFLWGPGSPNHELARA